MQRVWQRARFWIGWAAVLLLVAPAAGQVPDKICLMCHDDIVPESDTVRVHQEVSCVECHVQLFDFDPLEEDEHALDLAPVKCTVCHGDQAGQLRGSVHGARFEGDTRDYPSCTSCHGAEHFPAPMTEWETLDRKRHATNACASCHQKDVQGHQGSRHHEALAAGDPRAPSCVDCHDYHGVLKPSDPNATVHPNNSSGRCESCHEQYRAGMHRPLGEEPSGLSCTYCHMGHQTDQDSLSARIDHEGGANKCSLCHLGQHTDEGMAHRHLSDRSLETPNCISCHVYHWPLVEGEPQPLKPQLDCARCHEEQHEAYSVSAHARSRSVGNLDPPTCVSCHGERDILDPGDGFDPETIVALCSSCHADYQLMLSYEINPHVVEGFEDTYHGKLYELLNTGKHFAICTDCHGYHNVLEPEDPDSSVNRRRLLETCRECHEDASENFITYLVHPVKATPEELAEGKALNGSHIQKGQRDESVALDEKSDRPDSGIYASVFTLASWFMKALFLGVMSFFILHTGLWLQRSVRQRQRIRYRYYRRFNGFERITHVLVNVSFLTLAFTGLPQSYAHTEMGRWILENVMSLGLAQELHYWAAGVTLLYFVLHLGQVTWNVMQRGWRNILLGPDSLVPRWKDVQDFVQHVKWFLGKGEQPRFDRWTYWEKFDYFAVFWGVFVIGFSGLIRWKEEFFGNLFGGGLVSIATTVHQEEALLATAFIFVVHFFNTHLRREKFPMDVSIYTGLISEHELKEERPEQYARLQESGQLAALERKSRSPFTLFLSSLWGATALFIGLFLLVLIIIGLVSEGI